MLVCVLNSYKSPTVYSDVVLLLYLYVKGFLDLRVESEEMVLQRIIGDLDHVNDMGTHTFGSAMTEVALRTLVGEGAENAVHMTIDPWQ